MNVPLWLDEPYEPRPALDGPARCSVCVVGAGVGGLAVAWHLAGRGERSVLVVDAGVVAGGASGRNGGFFLAGAAPMYDRARALWGAARAAGIYRATLETQLEMLAVAEEVGARGEFQLVGMLRLAVDAGEAAAVRAHHAALLADGFDGELVAEEDLVAAVRRPGRLGLLTPHDGAVHPARWLRALAAALEARGVRLCEGTRVVAPPAVEGGGVRVRTHGGDVLAQRVVVAADAGIAALVPSAAAVRSRRLNILGTAAAPLCFPNPVYARYGHEYVQQLRDGRIVLGGFSDLDGDASWTDSEEVSPVVQARLDSYLHAELGLSVEVTHRWVGLVGYSDDPLPVCGAVPGSEGRIFALGGYNGTGHVQGFLAARIVAETIVDGGSPSAGLYREPEAA